MKKTPTSAYKLSNDIYWARYHRRVNRIGGFIGIVLFLIVSNLMFYNFQYFSLGLLAFSLFGGVVTLVFGPPIIWVISSITKDLWNMCKGIYRYLLGD